MDFISIISKEAITSPPDWCFYITLVISICIVLISLPIMIKQKFTSFVPALICGAIAIVVVLVLAVSFSRFCSVPTGKYRYEATIDKDRVTVTEYEEFIKTYKPAINDGIYSWTSEEIN